MILHPKMPFLCQLFNMFLVEINICCFTEKNLLLSGQSGLTRGILEVSDTYLDAQALSIFVKEMFFEKKDYVFYCLTFDIR
jgi:hypothetical protein